MLVRSFSLQPGLSVCSWQVCNPAEVLCRRRSPSRFNEAPELPFSARRRCIDGAVICIAGLRAPTLRRWPLPLSEDEPPLPAALPPTAYFSRMHDWSGFPHLTTPTLPSLSPVQELMPFFKNIFSAPCCIHLHTNSGGECHDTRGHNNSGRIHDRNIAFTARRPPCRLDDAITFPEARLCIY